MTTRLVRASLVVLLGSLVWNVAHAAEPSSLEAAKEAFKAGQSAMQAGRYVDAVVQFRKAYVITGDGLVMGQVALSFEKAGDYEQALQSIQVYRDALPEEDRPSLDRLIKKYKREISRGRSRHLSIPESSSLEAPAAVAPAPSASGGETSAVTGKSGEKTNDDRAGAEPPRRRLWTWIAAGTAGALGVAALVVGLSAQSRFNKLDDRCGPRTGGLCTSSEVDSVRTQAIVTDVLWGTALAAGITAGVLYFVEGRRASAPKDDLDQPSRIDEEDNPYASAADVDDEVIKRIDVAPMVGMGTYGLGAVFQY